MARWWRDCVVVPAMHLFSGVSSRLPFSLAERMVPLLICLIFALRKRRAARGLICLCLVPLLLWGSLYFCPVEAPAQIDAAALENMCASLIDRLNENLPVFSKHPASDPQIKTANFPFWMRAANISGIFVPFTGEILISPDAAPAALPFLIAHEKMHLRGIANEGEANIAAWRECHAAGGEAAASADLWALGYGLRRLKRLDANIYVQTEARMHARLRSALRFLDVNAAPSSYENLAIYLAANPACWYNDSIPTMGNVIA